MSSAPTDAPSMVPAREAIEVRFTWDLSSIFPDWVSWDEAYSALDRGVEAFREYEGTLAQSPQRLLLALREQDALGQLAYKVWYYASLLYDQDQRDNEVNARRQRVQLLLARWRQATSWFNPELLRLSLATVREWLVQTPDLELYRFFIEDLFRQQEHVLDEAGERLLSLSSRLGAVPTDAYAALSTADARYPTISLASGDRVEVTYGQYRRLLATCREQSDRRAAYLALYDGYKASLNTYAALYNGVLQREWFEARARAYTSSLDAALFGNNIPPAVVHNLIRETKAGVESFRRYHRLRRRILGLTEYFTFDGFIPLVDYDVRYRYDDVLDWIAESVAPLGEDYQRRVRDAFTGRWIDVYENQGKRNGAYSAPVYGAHPYMLLNYNDTLDDVFTLAHEMGHSIHTLLSHESQPFVYAGYTIFVAEVPSTLSEALLLDFMLARATTREERVVLLQHAIDEIAGTFYNQVLFADFELQAHALVEQDQPITSDVLSQVYGRLLNEYWGDALTADDRAPFTWARIPHFFQSPFYVYQYATCYASTARLMQDIHGRDPAVRRGAVGRYLTLLRAGGSDHPMTLLRQAGVDLSEPETVRAVASQLDALVTRLEVELGV
ncbi:MAG: oligoendopeptidase F [Acidobacteriota bacterium]